MKKIYRHRTKSSQTVMDPFIPVSAEVDLNDVADKPFGYIASDDSLQPLDNISLSTVSVAEELHVEGLSYLDDDVIAGNGLTVHGDLIVDGTTYTTEEESLDTTSDYIVLRHNNASGLGSNEKSGMVVHNYASNKTAAIGVDKDGTWRISDNTSEATTTYTDISQWNGHFFSSIAQDTEVTVAHGALVAQDADYYDEVVWYNGHYYKWDSVHWFEVSLSDDDELSIDIESPVTDTATIAALVTQTKGSLFYYRSLSVMTVTDSENQPLLTRAEATSLSDNGLLKWDATEQKAVGVAVPVLNNTVLTAQISSTATTTYSYNGSWISSDFSSTVQPSGTMTSQTAVLSNVAELDGNYYQYSDGYWYLLDSIDDVGTQVTDAALIAELDATMTYTVYEEQWTATAVGYDWKSGGSGAVLRYSTYAEYASALDIPEGQEGYVTDNALVIIDEMDNYVMSS